MDVKYIESSIEKTAEMYQQECCNMEFEKPIDTYELGKHSAPSHNNFSFNFNFQFYNHIKVIKLTYRHIKNKMKLIVNKLFNYKNKSASVGPMPPTDIPDGYTQIID